MLLLLVFLGCGNEDQPAPWERDGSATARRDAGHAADAGAFTPTLGRSLPPGGHTIRAGGYSMEIEGEAIASLATDLDGDGHDDLVVASRPLPEPSDAGPTSAVLAQISAWRVSDRLVLSDEGGDPVTVGRLCDPTVKLRRATQKSIVVDASNDCPEERLRTSALIPVRSGARPRMRVTLTGRGADPGTVALEPGDADGDGAEDVGVRLAIQTPHGKVETRLAYLDRSAGLTADSTEPEKTYASLVERASRKNVRPPERAEKLRAVLDLRRLLCEGSLGETRIAIDAGGPRRCDDSAAIGRAVDKLVHAEIDRGDPLAARRALGELGRPGVRLGEEARTALERAIDEASPPVTARATRGPSLEVSAIPPVRAGALRFLDDGRLLIGGATVLTVRTGATEPAPEETELRVVSPDGATWIAGVGDRCGEPVALLCAAGARCAFDDPTPRTVALRATRPAAPPPPCPSVHPGPGPRIVGWTAAGILWIAPGTWDLYATSPDGEATRPVTPEMTPPPGSPFADRGRTAVLADPTGLWLREGTAPPRIRRIVPEGVSPPWDRFADLTVSPSGHVLAGVRDAVVWVFEIPETPTP